MFQKQLPKVPCSTSSIGAEHGRSPAACCLSVLLSLCPASSLQLCLSFGCSCLHSTDTKIATWIRKLSSLLIIYPRMRLAVPTATGMEAAGLLALCLFLPSFWMVERRLC